MQGRQPQFRIDTANLVKAGTIPIIAAVIAGLIWISGINNPISIVAIVTIMMIFAFAGYRYANQILMSGRKSILVEVAINGAILGIVISLVYGIVASICISVATNGYYGVFNGLLGSGGLILTGLVGAIAGAVSACGWYKYKSGTIETD